MSLVNNVYGISYENTPCSHNNPEVCPVWTTCDETSEICRPCVKCLSGTEVTNKKEDPIYNCRDPLYCVAKTSNQQDYYCPKLKIADGYNCNGRCNLKPWPLGVVLGTTCKLWCVGEEHDTESVTCIYMNGNGIWNWTRPPIWIDAGQTTSSTSTPPIRSTAASSKPMILSAPIRPIASNLHAPEEDSTSSNHGSLGLIVVLAGLMTVVIVTTIVVVIFFMKKLRKIKKDQNTPNDRANEALNSPTLEDQENEPIEPTGNQPVEDYWPSYDDPNLQINRQPTNSGNGTDRGIGTWSGPTHTTLPPEPGPIRPPRPDQSDERDEFVSANIEDSTAGRTVSSLSLHSDDGNTNWSRSFDRIDHLRNYYRILTDSGPSFETPSHESSRLDLGLRSINDITRVDINFDLRDYGSEDMLSANNKSNQ